MCVCVCVRTCLAQAHNTSYVRFSVAFLEAPLKTAPAAPALSVSRMLAKSPLPVGQDRGSATLGPKEGGVAGSRRPKAGSGPRPQCFSRCLSLPATPAQHGDPGGPREGGLRPLAGAGDNDAGRPRGRRRRLAQSPSDLDGPGSILFPGEGNLLLPFLSSPSLPSSLPPWGAQVPPLPEAPKPQPPEAPAQRAQGPASLVLGPASPSVFPTGNQGAQRLASLPCLPPLERGCLIKGEPAMYTSDKSNAQNKLIKTLCLQHILFLSLPFLIFAVF